MSTLTKEWLLKTIAELEEERDAVPGVVNEDAVMALAAMKLALASLQAEAVAIIDQANLDYLKSGTDADVWPPERAEMGDVLLYRTAPPATVSVPDGVLKNLLPDAEKPEFWFEHNGTIFFEGVKFNNAVFDACRAAMLQGAEPVTTAYKLPDDFDFDRFNDVVWLETVASNPHMHSPTTSTIAMVALELNRKLAAGNSPVIPDGWVVVPVEPTEDMIVNGFESEPDESFSDEKEWEAYDAMSGCQQAAHRAKLCWAAMISAAPKPDAR